MSLTISHELLLETTREAFEEHRDRESKFRRDRDVNLSESRLSDDDLRDLLAAAGKVEDAKTAKAIDAILKARSGALGLPVPNFKAFEGMLRPLLKKDLIDGWIYVRGPDGKLTPELVTDIVFHDGNDHRGRATPHVSIETACYSLDTGSRTQSLRLKKTSHRFSPGEVTKKRVADILSEARMLKETPELKAEYLRTLARHEAEIAGGFGKQFRFTGAAFLHEENDYQRRGELMMNRKVIHDLDADACAPKPQYVDSIVGDDGTGLLPEHPVVRVFDLKAHEFYWVHSDLMTPYVYDKSLRDKLVLPATHRDLLDVLTTDIDVFTTDIIEGKAAGNILLVCGASGLGKTLSAEIYAELMCKPLYCITAGALGTTPDQVNKSLDEIFMRARRWDCPLLLDECDVYVMKRGTNLEQNAIVAEFLRVLEYFEKLLFLTTNRKDDIDDAIISRCAAIIQYVAPPREDARSVWRVMATQFDMELEGDLVEQLLDLFPGIAPRDIKMLLRLALRVARHHQQELSVGLFRQCAMFRAITMAAEAVSA